MICDKCGLLSIGMHEFNRHWTDAGHHDPRDSAILIWWGCPHCGRAGYNALGVVPEDHRCPSTVKPTTANCCLKCGVELSKTLDAYYGRDLGESQRCSKCRTS